jgi:hypothetical protein
MTTLQLVMPPKTNFMQDDLPSPETHHMKCFGCAFLRPSLQYQVLEDEECSNHGGSEKDVKCLPASKWKSLVNAASMKKKNGGVATSKPDFSYNLRSYNLNFDKGENY